VRISPFKIGLALVIVGAIWMSIIFMDAEKNHDQIVLKQSSSFEIKSHFTGTDIGFYRIHMPEFAGEEIFIQILDISDNVIQEQVIQTRMSVGYFGFAENGEYSAKVTNLTKNQVSLEIEFGNTNSKEMIPSGIMALVGSIAMIAMSYLKIKNYKMAQPDENIS